MEIKTLERHLDDLRIERGRQEIVRMWAAAPARKVGKRALSATLVHFQSLKNQRALRLESHTVEMHFAYTLELDPDVMAYACQIHCPTIERRDSRGRRQVSSGNVDFLVVRTDRIELVECKSLDTVEKLVKDEPAEYAHWEGRFTRPPYRDWAASRGLDYRIWTPPRHSGILLRNLQLLYGVKRLEMPNPKLADTARDLLARGSLTIDEVCQKLAPITPRHVAFLLAEGSVHGPLEHIALDETHRFPIFADRYAADIEADLLARGIARNLSGGPSLLSRAWRTQLERARKRLDQIHAYQAGEVRGNGRLRQRARQVAEAQAAGRNPLEVLLPKFPQQGNRGERYTETTYEVMKKVFKDEWDSGKCKTYKAVFIEVEEACKAAGLTPPGRWLVESRLRARSRTSRDLATGGRRAYHANRTHSSPLVRSGAVVARGLVLQIDSTLGDHRSFELLFQELALDRPTIYVGTDTSTHECMAFAMGFGAASRWGLAFLIRDYVRRQGFLPHSIRVDRGPEFGPWLVDFCDFYQIDLLWNATADSRSSSDPENLHNRIRTKVLQHLPGSTEPDKANRASSSQFKSRNTASLRLKVVRNEIENYLMEELPITPLTDGIAPADLADGSRGAFQMGLPCEMDDIFHFLTSIPSTAKQVDLRNRIHLGCANYSSDALSHVRRLQSRGIDVRIDCENYGVLRVGYAHGIATAFSSQALRLASCDAGELQFELMSNAELRRAAVGKRQALDKARHGRNKELASQPRPTFAASNQPGQAEPAKRAIPDEPCDLSIDFEALGDLKVVRE